MRVSLTLSNPSIHLFSSANMTIIHQLLLTLGLLVLGIHSQELLSFNDVCNPPNYEDQEISTGIFVKYTCGRLPSGDNGNWVGDGNTDNVSPTQCAKICAARSSEGPCGWWDNTCFQFKSSDKSVKLSTGLTITITRKDSVQLEKACEEIVAQKTDQLEKACEETVTQKTGEAEKDRNTCQKALNDFKTSVVARNDTECGSEVLRANNDRC